jgi:hypothetical protein
VSETFATFIGFVSETFARVSQPCAGPRPLRRLKPSLPIRSSQAAPRTIDRIDRRLHARRNLLHTEVRDSRGTRVPHDPLRIS